MKNITLSLLTLMALSTSASADDIATTDVEAKYSNKNSIEASKELKQSINLGFSNTTGNSETLNINGKYDATLTTTGYNNNPLKVVFDASGYFTENNSVKSNEEFIANLGLEQLITNGWLGYAGASWLRNPDFKNYNSKTGINMGVGKELYNDGTQRLTAKLGTSYNIEAYANEQETKEFGALNEYLEYNNQLNTISNFYVKAGAMQNFDDMQEDYEAVGIVGINFAVGENINLSIEEELAYDNLPPEGFEKTDTKSIVRLGYNF